MDEEEQKMYLGLLLGAGCTFVSKNYIWCGKHGSHPYVWMNDPRGNLFLERIPDDS